MSYTAVQVLASTIHALHRCSSSYLGFARTERENAARKVERTMRKVAAAVFLTPRIGETFDAVVTGAADKGVFVRLLHPAAEGRVVSGERGLDVGDRVRVRLVDTAPLKGFIDFAALRG